MGVDGIRARLEEQRRQFFSLRLTAKILGVSTQPVRDWIRLGHLKRDGPRRQLAKAELERFLDWLSHRAEPFEAEHYRARLTRTGRRIRDPFQTLSESRFLWPAGRDALTPRELAALIGCHPSLLIKAIHRHRWARFVKRKSPRRWEISRRAWQATFPCSKISWPRSPAAC